MSDTKIELSPREREVAILVIEGRRNRDVAEQLGVSAETVKSHVKSMFRKLEVGSRTELAARIHDDPSLLNRTPTGGGPSSDSGGAR